MAKKVEFNMNVAKKYIFWACTPLGLIGAVVAGYIAIASIASDLETQTRQLESQREAMNRLQGESANHPNEGTISAVNEMRDEQAENVYASWETLERRQREQNTWGELANVAIREIESKKFLDSLTGATLDNYLTFARNSING
jgi:hypothetical protein